MQSNTDQLPRLLCNKYLGGRSPLYNKWEEEMLDAAAGKGDEDASWAQTLLRTDNAVGLTAAQSKRRNQRLRETYSQMVQLQEDESLKALLRAEAQNRGDLALNILRRECRDSRSALSINKKILEWHQLSID